jgi:hypothetical protein
MNLKIKVQKEIEVPDNTKVINNSSFITLAYIKDGVVNVCTKTAEEIFNTYHINSSDFIAYNKKEVEKMLEMLNLYK